MLDKRPDALPDVKTLYGDTIRNAHGARESPVSRTTVLQTLLMYNRVHGEMPLQPMPRIASMDEEKMKVFFRTMVYPSTSPPFNRPGAN